MKFSTLKSFFLATTFVLINSFLFAQTASFTIDKTSGCNPLTVKFTNTSTGATSYKWELGNGNTSTSVDATEIYTIPKVYTIKLTAFNGTKQSSVSKTVEVYADPVANFSVSKTNFCVPFDAQFKDASTGTSGTITSWSWSFGDGKSSTNENPTNSYVNVGSWNVVLEVTDNHGCKNKKTVNNFITTTNPPVVNFSGTPRIKSEPPLVVKYTNSSIGTGALTYNWTFGNGATSTLLNPSATYNNVQTYDVSLKVTDVNGCYSSATYPAYIEIASVKASFTVADTICYGVNTYFANTTYGGVSYVWDFGDGTPTSTVTNPYHTFNKTGSYTISLVAKDKFGAADTYSKTIFVEEVKADYSLSTEKWCKTPVEIDFTNLSTSNDPELYDLKYIWSFGDGNSSSNKNPSNTYTSEGSFLTKLDIESVHGCKSSKSINFTIAPIIASITTDTNRACIPLPVDFTYSSNSVWSIINWNWNFEDGGTSTDSMPTHIFNQAGDFNVTLNIINSIGCEANATFLLEAGAKFVAEPLIQEPITCATDPVMFKDVSDDGDGDDNVDLIDFWWWNPGEGEPEGFVKDYSNPYKKKTGDFEMEFVVGYNGCFSDTTRKPILIYGPIIYDKKIDAKMDCKDPYTFDFMFELVDAISYTIDFGDGTPKDSINLGKISSLKDTITHTYAPSTRGKDLTVTVKAYNDSVPMNVPEGCDFEATFVVKIRDIKANLIIPQTACADKEISFNYSNSIDLKTYSFTSFNRKTLQTKNITTPYTFNSDIDSIPNNYDRNNVIYDITLIATTDNISNCSDTISGSIKTYRPNVKFSAGSTLGCTPLNVTFYDSTQNYSDTTLAKWYWDFGNGKYETLTTNTTSSVFELIQTYNIKLTVEDDLGCTNSNTISIIATKPQPKFNISDLQLCTGDSVILTNQTTEYGTFDYIWDFGDLTPTKTNKNTSHHYLNSGIYTISLYAIDSLGCDSTFYTKDTVDVQAYPIPLFTADTTVWECNLLYKEFSFTDTTKSNIIDTTSYIWNFGDGASSNLVHPVNVYDLAGKYNVSLSFSTTYGCRDTTTIEKYITIKGPEGTSVIDPDTVCRGELIKFLVADTKNVDQINWFFGDGTSVIKGDTLVTHAYNVDSVKTTSLQLQSYMDRPIKTLIDPINMIYTIDSICTKVIQYPIFVHQVRAKLSSTGDQCVDVNAIQFDGNESYSHNDSIINWNWDFGDGKTETGKLPAIHTYDTLVADTFNVKLIVEDSFGCFDTTQSIIEVYPLPIVAAGKDTLICRYISTNLWATGGLSYDWFPTKWETIANDSNPTVTPDSTTTYYAMVTDSNGCVSKTNGVLIEVQQPLKMEYLFYHNDTLIDGTEISIILGDTISVKSNSHPDVISDWAEHSMFNCFNCDTAYSVPMVAKDSVKYTAFLKDPNGCNFTAGGFLSVFVKDITLDVPTAFTPNGDNVNDVIYAKGWGIAELTEFKIFNRWGQIVFETTDLNEGWKGDLKGNGVIQNIDTYVYIVTGKAFNGRALSKKGYINLIK